MLIQKGKEPRQVVLTAEEARAVLRMRELAAKENEAASDASTKKDQDKSASKLRPLYG